MDMDRTPFWAIVWHLFRVGWPGLSTTICISAVLFDTQIFWYSMWFSMNYCISKNWIEFESVCPIRDSGIEMSYGNLKVWRHKALILVKGVRNYSSNSRLSVNLEKLGPLIMKRIAQTKNDPLKQTLPVAREVLRARNALYDGVSILIRHIPVWTCKYLY